METLTIILTSLLTLSTPGNLVADRFIESAIRSEFKNIETLAVRTDNLPTYNLIRGQVDRLRVASRGVQIVEEFRIDTIEVELDPFNVNVGEGQKQELVQGGIRLVFTEEDINQTLNSTNVQNILTELLNEVISNRGGSQASQYQLSNLNLDFLPGQRLRFQVQLDRAGTGEREDNSLAVAIESKVEVIAGRSLQIQDLQGTVNDRPLPQTLLNRFAQGLSNGLDLRQLEREGITLRVLQLNMDEEKLELAAFFRFIDEDSSSSN